MNASFEAHGVGSGKGGAGGKGNGARHTSGTTGSRSVPVPPDIDPSPLGFMIGGSGKVSEMNDALGDRMKSYEAVEDRRLDGHLPIYARVDGRSFSRFTAGMRRPFEPAMTAAMVATAAGLVERTHARIGYAQSDEISLVWLSSDDASQVIFDGRIQKLCSVLAGLATALFMVEIAKRDELPSIERLPHFDCRVIQLPSKTEAANMFLWRELDAQKNAISSAARGAFSHKALQDKNGAEMLAMLEGAGVSFAAYPPAFRHGTFLRRETTERPFEEAEWLRIPERHRPARDSRVLRSEVRAMNMPPFGSVLNREGVIFDGEAPETADAMRLAS